MTDGQDRPQLLADRLNQLFQRGRPGGKRWTNDEVAAAVKDAHPGLKVTGAYLSALRTGKRTNPSSELQEALAGFFGVSPSFFVDPDHAERVLTQLDLLDKMRQAGVRSVAARAVGLDPESLDAVTAVLDDIRRRQGLPPVDE